MRRPQAASHARQMSARKPLPRALSSFTGWSPRSGDSADNPRRVRSLLNIRKPLQHGQFIWNDTGVAAGPVWLRVDVKAQTISVFRAGHEIGTAVVLYGADKKPTPLGTFAVLDKRRDHVSTIGRHAEIVEREREDVCGFVNGLGQRRTPVTGLYLHTNEHRVRARVGRLQARCKLE